MSLRRFTTAAFAAAIMAGAAIGPVTAAVGAPHSSKLTIYITQTERNVLDLGAPGTSAGDVVTGSGDLSRSKGGSSIGSFAYRAETVRVNIPGGIENRMSTQSYTLPKGTLLTSALISVPQGTRPVASQEFVILGGTGAFSGAHGTMTFVPKGPDDYVATFHFTD